MRGAASVIVRLWEGWKRVAGKVADFQARLLLSGFYFLVAAPFALIVKWSSDPLALAPGTRKGWHPRAPAPGTPLERARRQA